MTLRNLPAKYPSVTFDFHKSKQLDPRITFTRASYSSGGSPVNQPSAGTGTHSGTLQEFNINVPRLTDKGLLIEESRTNLMQNSESGAASKWTASSGVTITASTNTAPDGTITAIRIQMTVAGQFAERAWTAPSDGTYAGSLFVRSRTGTDQTVRLDYSGVTTTNQTIPASGQWVRIEDTQGVTVGAGGRAFYLQGLTTETLDVDVWGEQVEAGSFMTSYIPTPSGTTVTRAVDLCEISGDNFSSWYAQGTGTLVSNWVSPDDDSKVYSSLVNIKSGTNKSAPGISVYTWTGAAGLRDVKGTVTGSQVDWQNVVTPNTPLKLGITYDASTQSTTYNGNTPKSVAITTAVPTMTRIDMGDHFAINDRYANGYLKRVSYYPTRLSDTALQALTN